MAGRRLAPPGPRTAGNRAHAATIMTRHDFIAKPPRDLVPGGVRVAVYADLDALPPRFDALFAEGARQSVFLSRAWFANLAANAAGPICRPRLYALESAEPKATPLALLAMQHSADEPGMLRALAAAYTCDFAPLLHAGALRSHGLTAAQALGTLARAIRAERPAWASVRLDYLPADQALYADLCAAFAAAGYAVGRYRNFANWFEPIEGPSLDAYLSGRPSALRNTLKRKAKKLDQAGDARFELIATAAPLPAALAAYESIYAASWKEAEAAPNFIPGLMRAMAREGWLRLGIMHVGGEPAAAQLWLVAEGRAVIYKLAYHPRFAHLSVGSLLTLRMVERAIEADGVREIDYGSGDDAYKKDWMSRRRERWGMVAFNPFSPRGLIGLCRHGAGRVRRLLAKR